MPNGKAAGVRCPHLDERLKCKLFNSDSRPQVCKDFKPEKAICGSCQAEAIQNLKDLEGIA